MLPNIERAIIESRSPGRRASDMRSTDVPLLGLARCPRRSQNKPRSYNSPTCTSDARHRTGLSVQPATWTPAVCSGTCVDATNAPTPGYTRLHAAGRLNPTRVPGGVMAVGYRISVDQKTLNDMRKRLHPDLYREGVNRMQGRYKRQPLSPIGVASTP